MDKLFPSGLLWDVLCLPVKPLGIATDEDSRALVWSTLASMFPIKYSVLQMLCSRANRAALTLVPTVLQERIACPTDLKNISYLIPDLSLL